MPSEIPTTRSNVPEAVACEHLASARGYLDVYSPACVSRRSIDVLRRLLDGAWLAGQSAERERVGVRFGAPTFEINAAPQPTGPCWTGVSRADPDLLAAALQAQRGGTPFLMSQQGATYAAPSSIEMSVTGPEADEEDIHERQTIPPTEFPEQAPVVSPAPLFLSSIAGTPEEVARIESILAEEA